MWSFFGPGVAQLSIADRATIANMCPEYGATAAFFPVDEVSIKYLLQTGKRAAPCEQNALCKVHRALRIQALPSASAPWRIQGHIHSVLGVFFSFSLWSQNDYWDFRRYDIDTTVWPVERA